MRSAVVGSPRRSGRRSHPLTGLLVVLLVAVPIVEVWLLIQVGQALGVLPTMGLIVAEAVLGAWLLRREGSRAYTTLTSAFATGKMPTVELADGALVLVGGVLLMLPGFVTDLVGLGCLLPITRPAARRLLGFLIGQRMSKLNLARSPQQLDLRDVIPGETVDPERSPNVSRRADPGVIVGEIEDEPR